MPAGHVRKARRQDEVKKIKLCRKSLPFASLAECVVSSNIYNKPFEKACEDIVFTFENDFKLNVKIILTREDVVFNLPVPQITGSSRRPFLHFLT